MKRSRMSVYIWCLGIGLAVFGCSENNENRPSITPSRPASTVTTAPSRTPSPSNTATPVVTPTQIPVPTLPPEKAQAMVLDLLYNPPCDLPCWWGMTPGITTWEEANRFLRKMGYVLMEGIFPEGNTFTEQILFQVPEEINEFRGSIFVTLGIDGGIVKEIRTRPGKVPGYSMSGILKANGPPDEIWIYRYSEGPIESFHLNYFLFYQKKGILVGMSAPNSPVTGTLVEGCINSDYVPIEGPSIFLWEADPHLSFVMVKMEGIITRDPVFIPDEAYLLLEEIEVNGMDEQDFYDIFVNPSTEFCIKTPRDKWPYLDTSY